MHNNSPVDLNSIVFSRLGPPDFNPPTLNCPEETLTKEYVQSGYRETVEGLEVCEYLYIT